MNVEQRRKTLSGLLKDQLVERVLDIEQSVERFMTEFDRRRPLYDFEDLVNAMQNAGMHVPTRTFRVSIVGEYEAIQMQDSGTIGDYLWDCISNNDPCEESTVRNVVSLKVTDQMEVGGE